MYTFCRRQENADGMGRRGICKKHICVVSCFFVCVMQLHFALRVFLEMVCSQPRCQPRAVFFSHVCGMLFLFTLYGEWLIFMTSRGFAHVHSCYWTPETKRTTQMLSWGTVLRRNVGISGCRCWHASGVPTGLGRALGFVSCHLEAPWSVRTMFPIYHIGSRSAFQEDFVLWREKAAPPVLFHLPAPTLGFDEEEPSIQRQ